MEWVEHVARIVLDEKCVQNVGWKTLKGRDHAKDPGVDERIILEWILEKEWESCGLDASSLG
jgi:hypothetical protein